MNNLHTNAYPQGNELTVSSSRNYNLAVATFGLLTALGLAAGLHAMLIGHDHAFGITREVPWGLLISAYVFFVVTSTGLCLVSSIGHVFNIESLKPIAKRSVFMAIVTIIAGFMVIAFEIATPWRMPIYNMTSPNITSNIWWMGTLYGAYLFFMLVEYALLSTRRFKQAGLFGLAAVISGIAAHSNLGAVFGLLAGRDFWHGPYMPIYFITSAMMSGCAAVIFFSWLGYRSNRWQMSDAYKNSLHVTAKLMAMLICIIAFFTAWKMIGGLAGKGAKYDSMMALINGPFSVNFWIGEIMLGMVIPFALIMLARAKNLKTLFVASASCIIGIFIMRYDLVIVGQVIPHFSGMGIVDLPKFFPYSPSLHEILITVGGLALCGMAFLMGERLFKGHLSEDH